MDDETEFERAWDLESQALMEQENERLRELIEDFDAWARHEEHCDMPYYGRECNCGLAALRERANATSVASPVELPTEPAPSLEVERHEIKGPNIVVDTRPRCGMPNRFVTDIFCDQPLGHEGNHSAYYGWNGKAEVWS